MICRVCSGSGWLLNYRCPSCDGSGYLQAGVEVERSDDGRIEEAPVEWWYQEHGGESGGA